MSDLVIIPMQPSGLDAAGSRQGVEPGQAAGKKRTADRFHMRYLLPAPKPPCRPPAPLRPFRNNWKAKVSVFEYANFRKREVYRDIFDFGGTLEDLDPKDVYKVEDAIGNARNFAGEVLAMVKRTASPATPRQVEVA